MRLFSFALAATMAARSGRAAFVQDSFLGVRQGLEDFWLASDAFDHRRSWTIPKVIKISS